MLKINETNNHRLVIIFRSLPRAWGNYEPLTKNLIYVVLVLYFKSNAVN